VDKVAASPEEAVADIGDGASIGIAGFGVAHRFPSSLIVAMCEHTDSAGQPKLVGSCEFEVTAPGCVDTVVTDLALLRRTDGGFRLDEIARGFTPGEVTALTSMPVEVTGAIGIMQECWGD